MTALPKAVKIALSLVPALMRILPEIEAKVAAAKAPGSAGGSKVTPAEIAEIVVAEISPVVHAVIEAVTAAVS